MQGAPLQWSRWLTARAVVAFSVFIAIPGLAGEVPDFVHDIAPC
jgi:hypothetical protein